MHWILLLPLIVHVFYNHCTNKNDYRNNSQMAHLITLIVIQKKSMIKCLFFNYYISICIIII